jgi:hypothetical protein
MSAWNATLVPLRSPVTGERCHYSAVAPLQLANKGGSIMKKIGLLVLSLLLLSACGSKLDGTTYQISNPIAGKISLKFESGGKVYMKVMGAETEMKYEVDGNKVKLITPQGNQILTLREDGSLEGMPIGIMRKI